MNARSWLPALLLAPSLAWAEGGGGVTLDLQYLPRYGEPWLPHDAPGVVGCIGGVGYGVSKKGFRIGGEGVWCKGRREGVDQVYGGMQLGRWWGSGHIYWSGYVGVGGGMLTDGTVHPEDPYRSMFLYLKPTMAVGFAFRVVALEIGFYGFAPLNVAQWVGPYDGRGLVTPQIGLGTTLLFGDLHRERKKSREAAVEERPPAPEYAPPAPPPIVEPSDPDWQGQEPVWEGEPLPAVPQDEASYPEEGDAPSGEEPLLALPVED